VAPLGRACFSAFAATRNAGSDTAGTFLRLMSGAAMLGLPAAVGISVVAGPVVRLAFGDRWLTAIPLIEILGVTLTVTVFGTISAVLLTAYAALKPQFRVQVLAIMLRIAAMVGLVVPFGLPGAALGLSLSLAVEHSVYTGMALRCLGLGWTDLLRQVWRSGLATLFMVAVLAALGLAWRDVAAEGTALVWLLVVPIGIGAAVYTAVLLLLWLAAGRPSGAEQDAITVIRTAWFRAIG
jgi:O-antigen/teichoic acid export membrane protein